MRVCPICSRGLRINDPSGCATVPEGFDGIKPGHYGGVCSECCAQFDPDGPWTSYVTMVNDPFPLVVGDGVPRTYPGGLSDSQQGMDHAPAWFCGICRRFARDGDRMEAMRLYPEDAPDHPELFPSAVCSHFNEAYCSECEWTGFYEERCPSCWQHERLNNLPHHEPRSHTRRECDWFGPYRQFCPKCGDSVRQREECYYACGECRVKYWPAIVKRLKRQGIVNQSFPESTPPIAHMLT